MLKLLLKIDRYSLAILASVVVASLLPASGIFALWLGWIVKAAIALLFFLHGAKLSRAAILAGLTNWKLHVTVLLATFLLFPVLGLGISALSALFLPGLVATGFLFLTLLPSTVQSSIAFTSIARGNVPAAVCAASFSNFAGIFVTPALTALLLGGASGTGDTLASIEAIVMQLLLPFLAGHLSRPLTARFIERHKAVVSYVDRGSILLVVYAAFSAAVVEGLWKTIEGWQLAAIIGLCGAMLAVVLGIVAWTAHRMGFDRPDRAAIIFCGSKKSLASGVPMAGVLFPAAMVGPLILPLMIFHQLQLLACAAIAQRMSAKVDPETQPREPAPTAT
ncbi:MAG: bile acid:sodium symporter [Croceicoccus sp.]|nr:bile acid:sodium symporter [Croceicoccus sp.]MAL27446.1 bile acid:sodium symporter [Croceicoccus sp.]